MIFWIISFTQIETVHSTTPLTYLETFGFDENGTYSVEIFLNKGTRIHYLLQTRQESHKVNQETISLYCSNLASIPGIYFNVTQKILIKGTVSSKTILHPVILNCDTIISNRDSLADLKITSTFINPKTHLDIRWNGYQNEKVVIAIIMTIALNFWFFNWFKHFSVQIYIHYALTTSFILTLITTILRYFHLRQMDIEENVDFINTFYHIFLFFTLSIGFSTLLFAAKGWCIVRDSLSLKDFISSIGFSSALCLFAILFKTIAYPYWLLTVITFFGLAVCILYVYILMRSINDITMHLMGHMLVISNSGIDPTTTPIFQKHKMYNRFQYGICFSCFLIISLLLVRIFWPDYSYVIMEGLTEGFLLVVLIFFGIIFRLQGSQIVEGYTLVEEAGEMLSLDDLKNINMSSPEMKKGGQTWTTDTPLPPEPTVVTIQSPDGTESIQAHLIANNETNDEA